MLLIQYIFLRCPTYHLKERKNYKSRYTDISPLKPILIKNKIPSYLWRGAKGLHHTHTPLVTDPPRPEKFRLKTKIAQNWRIHFSIFSTCSNTPYMHFIVKIPDGNILYNIFFPQIYFCIPEIFKTDV